MSIIFRNAEYLTEIQDIPENKLGLLFKKYGLIGLNSKQDLWVILNQEDINASAAAIIQLMPGMAKLSKPNELAVNLPISSVNIVNNPEISTISLKVDQVWPADYSNSRLSPDRVFYFFIDT